MNASKYATPAPSQVPPENLTAQINIDKVITVISTPLRLDWLCKLDK